MPGNSVWTQTAWNGTNDHEYSRSIRTVPTRSKQVNTRPDTVISERATNKQLYIIIQHRFPYCRPEACSSRRQHHEREAAHPRCIGAYYSPPRIGRVGGADAYTTTTPHQPSPTATRKLTLCSVLLTVVAMLAAAACDSSVVTTRACCHRLPHLCTRPPPRSASAIRVAMPGFFLVCCCRSHSTLCV